MDHVVPVWLNKEFIREALQDGKDAPDITVENIKVDRPIAKGDNYMCDIFRATVEYRMAADPMKTSLIVKSPIVGGLADVVIELGVLQKEGRIYNEYIPKMDQLLELNSSITPKSFYSSKENVLVLEDVKYDGYTMADRRVQLDYEQTVIGVKTLARFHAASVRLHDDEPDFVEEIGKEVFFIETCPDSVRDYVRSGFIMMANETKNVPSLAQYTEQLLRYSENAWDLLVELVKPKRDKLNVLNHGDFWVNNMLFKYDESNNPVGLKMLDFQESRYTLPTCDLLQLLYGSVQEEVRTNRLSDILDIYLDELNDKLELFGASQTLTAEELDAMIKESEFLCLLVTVWSYPVVTSDPKDGVMDLSEVTDDQLRTVENNPLRYYYKSERLLNTCTKRFDDFKKMGLFY